MEMTKEFAIVMLTNTNIDDVSIKVLHSDEFAVLPEYYESEILVEDDDYSFLSDLVKSCFKAIDEVNKEIKFK
jgi:hypothetical protein